MTHAMVLTEFGGPEVLHWREVEDPAPGVGEILVRVKAAGIGPTDLNIRAGHLAKVFPQGPGSVLGFEAAGVVEQLGEGVDGVVVGDEVALYLPHQGGYGELVTGNVWYAKPPEVTWEAAAALPASAEAALGILRELGVQRGETLVVLGAAGSVGVIAVQLARSFGVRVIGAAAPHDEQLVRDLGAEFVAYGDGVFERIGALSGKVDAVADVAGHGGLTEAVAATGDSSRVVTLADPVGAAASGARMSDPGPNRAPDALKVTMPLLADGSLRLKAQLALPLTDAAEAHRLLESGQTHDKIVLTYA